MKIAILLSFLVVLGSLASCGDDILTIEQQQINVATRGMSIEEDEISQTNPNLLTDWENTVLS